MAEYRECLLRNLEGGVFDEVCVLSEGAAAHLPEHPRLKSREVSRRPFYDDFFAWMNELSDGKDISVVANTDIWFDGSLRAARAFLGPLKCWALSRWDGKVLYDHNDSQDCWVFQGKVSGITGDFPTGVARCDNRFIYELQAAGYEVANPAFSVKAHHIHSGDRVPYPHDNLPHFVAPPYRYRWPHNLCSFPQMAWWNTTHPRERIGWTFDKRRASGWLPVRIYRRGLRLLQPQAGKSGRLSSSSAGRD